jgi:hypothetical protein
VSCVDGTNGACCLPSVCGDLRHYGVYDPWGIARSQTASKSRCAEPDDARIGDDFPTRRLDFSGEVDHHNELVVEQPEVVAGHRNVGRLSSREPAHPFAGKDIREREVVLEVYVLADRLGDYAGSADLDTPRVRVGHRLVPGAPPGLPVLRSPPPAGLPGDEPGSLRM